MYTNLKIDAENFCEDEEYDPLSDPFLPIEIIDEDILEAAKTTQGYVERTTCKNAPNMSALFGMEIFLKLEVQQRTGSFKDRGAVNALLNLTQEERARGVITASTGNFGISLCHYAKKLKIKCLAVLPKNANMYKVLKCAEYATKVVRQGKDFAGAKRYAMATAKRRNMIFVNGFDHPRVIEGDGTVGLEIFEDLPDVDAVVVPVGSGGLLCGIAMIIHKYKPTTEIYGVETDKNSCLTESLRQGQAAFLKKNTGIADAGAVNTIGPNVFYNIKEKCDIEDTVIVNEDWIPRAILHLVEDEHCVAEPAGALAVAAIAAGLLPNLKGKTVACVITGGNIDIASLTRLIKHGVASESRLVKFLVIASDNKDPVGTLCNLLMDIGVTVRTCVPERPWMKNKIYSIQLNVVAETTSYEHTNKLISVIKKNYHEYTFIETGQLSDTADLYNPCRGACARQPPDTDNTD